MRGRTTQTTEEEGIGGGGVGGNEEERDDDESKTRKISLAMRITNLITYKFGVFWPCSFIIFSFLLLVSSLIIRSRNSVCVSTLDSRSLIGIDGVRFRFWYSWCSLVSKSGRVVEWTTKDLLSDWKSLCRYMRHGQSIIINTLRNEKYLKKGPAYVDGNWAEKVEMLIGRV
ncbi:hypothetical protein MKW98_009984 [Papaver atlanticum]|uniref:Transmembrane protein n=1 Tax=Papaver atlanticum TaxID=357466 RepID=A0AAD4T4P1_9MAGN|nr:hypothetical protein MKW98_009984 [Papaver atlanticum]